MDRSKPISQSREVHGGGDTKVLQMDFGQADIAGAALVVGADSLGKSAFDAGAGAIALLEGFVVLLLTHLLQQLVLFLRSDTQPSGAGGGAGTLATGGTSQAVAAGQANVDRLHAGGVVSTWRTR